MVGVDHQANELLEARLGRPAQITLGLGGVADELVGIAAKPPVLWVHGDADAIVGDATLFDLAQLGKPGIVPGCPGEDACPPQPMVAQTRAVLQRYAAAGGSFTEVLLDGCGHSQHIERPAEFLDALLGLIASAA